MEISIEKTGPCMRKVSIKIPVERIQEEMDKNYDQTTRSVSLPGFRKGKVPKKLIEKRFGNIILSEVKERLVQLAFAESIEEHGLEPVGEPNIDLAAMELKLDTPFEFEFEVESKPEFELGEYKELAVELEPLVVTDAEIDDGIKGVRSRFASLKSVSDKPVEDKHYLTLDLVYKVEGEEDVTREKANANMGMGIVDGIELKEGMKDFLGKKMDDQVDLDVPSLPDHFTPENLRGKPAKITAAIKDIQEVAFPELDDDFLKKINMQSVDELREKISEEMMEGKKAKREEEIDTKIVDILIENHSFDLPEKLLMEQITSQEQNLRYEMLRMGMPEDKVEEQASKFDDRNREAADRNIRRNFIYDKIARKEKIFVTENEVEKELRVIAEQQNARIHDVKRYYEENNLIGGLRSFLRNQKIRKILRDNAKIVEKSISEGSERVDPVEEASSGEETEGSTT
jgi:trigger factor